MSQPISSDSTGGKIEQKQQLNVYTVMLIAAFCAISIACLLLYLELRRWGSFPWWKAERGGSVSYIYQTEGPEMPVARLKPGTSEKMWV